MKHRIGVALAAAWLIWVAAPAWGNAAVTINLTPNPAFAGATVSVSGEIRWQDVPPSSGSCLIGSDASLPAPEAPTCTYTDSGTGTATIQGSFHVPSGVESGTAYPVHLCGPADTCDNGVDPVADAWYASKTLSIEQPVVPSVVCLPFSDARGTLSGSGFHAEPAERILVVGSQSPAAGTHAPVGSPVVLHTMRIPDLHALSFPAASQKAKDACAQVSADTTAGTVRGQDPEPGVPLGQPFQVITLTMTTVPPSSPSDPSSPTTPTTGFSTPTSSATQTSTPTSTATSGGGGHGDGGQGYHRPWWRRATWPTGSVLGLGAAVLLGVRQWRIHQPPTPMATRASVRAHLRDSTYVCPPPPPGRLAPSFVVRHHTTYRLREPS